MKRWTWFGGLIIIGLMFMVPAAFSADKREIASAEAFPQRERPVSLFDHDAHMDYPGFEDCNTCHHVYKDGVLIADESSEDKYCSDCHSVEGASQRPKLRTAFHRLCINCHEEQKMGPLSCGECHAK